MNSALSSPASAPAPASPEEAFRITGLVKRYGRKTVLDGLDWVGESGGVIGLIGRNGAGKTTLLRALLGLSPIDAGTIRVLGTEAGKTGGAVLHRIGYVPQTFDLFPWMKVRDYLDFTAAFYERWDGDLVERLLEEWRLPRRDKIATLSQGQRQMLAIVRALAPDPDLLVLDEPVASLDPAARREFLVTLAPLVRRPGKTVILSTHIVRDLERLEASLAILRDGRIVFALPRGDHTGRLALALVRDAPGLILPSDPPGILAVRTLGAETRIVYAREHEHDLSETIVREARARGGEPEFRPIDLEDLFVALA
jgi:ABC-2 type transport system ATP-binding protein